MDGNSLKIEPVLSADDIFGMQDVVRMIYTDDQLKNYILELVQATRSPQDYKLGELKPYIEFGASPRASIFLGLAARANAFLNGRGYVTPQDVKDIAVDVLRHRVILTYEAEAEQLTSDDIVKRILNALPVP